MTLVLTSHNTGLLNSVCVCVSTLDTNYDLESYIPLIIIVTNADLFKPGQVNLKNT